MNMFRTFNIMAGSILLILFTSTIAMPAWQVNIDVSTPDPASDTGLATNKLTIGTDPAATDSYDNTFDTVALLNGPVKAFVSHSEYPSEKQKLWRDIRSDQVPQEWSLEVESEVNKAVTVKWQSIPSGLRIVLLDRDSNEEIVMTSQSEYTYTNTTSNPKNLLLKVTAAPASEGGTRGGGCGYIRNTGGRNGGDNGQIAQTVLIMLLPVLLPLKKYLLRRAA